MALRPNRGQRMAGFLAMEKGGAGISDGKPSAPEGGDGAAAAGRATQATSGASSRGRPLNTREKSYCPSKGGVFGCSEAGCTRKFINYGHAALDQLVNHGKVACKTDEYKPPLLEEADFGPPDEASMGIDMSEFQVAPENLPAYFKEVKVCKACFELTKKPPPGKSIVLSLSVHSSMRRAHLKRNVPYSKEKGKEKDLCGDHQELLSLKEVHDIIISEGLSFKNLQPQYYIWNSPHDKALKPGVKSGRNTRKGAAGSGAAALPPKPPPTARREAGGVLGAAGVKAGGGRQLPRHADAPSNPGAPMPGATPAGDLAAATRPAKKQKQDKDGEAAAGGRGGVRGGPQQPPDTNDPSDSGSSSGGDDGEGGSDLETDNGGGRSSAGGHDDASPTHSTGGTHRQEGGACSTGPLQLGAAGGRAVGVVHPVIQDALGRSDGAIGGESVTGQGLKALLEELNSQKTWDSNQLPEDHLNAVDDALQVLCSGAVPVGERPIKQLQEKTRKACEVLARQPSIELLDSASKIARRREDEAKKLEDEAADFGQSLEKIRKLQVQLSGALSVLKSLDGQLEIAVDVRQRSVKQIRQKKNYIMHGRFSQLYSVGSRFVGGINAIKGKQGFKNVFTDELLRSVKAVEERMESLPQPVDEPEPDINVPSASALKGREVAEICAEQIDTLYKLAQNLDMVDLTPRPSPAPNSEPAGDGTLDGRNGGNVHSQLRTTQRLQQHGDTQVVPPTALSPIA